MKIRIRYFASLREVVGKSEEQLTVPDEASITDLRSQLLTSYPQLQPIMERSVCAVNHRYVPAETILHESDEVVFIPPTGGGQEWNQ
jgi:molybdopterin synthase sulfur carrier subunit